MILKVVRLFHDALLPGGYLFLGHAESLSRITDLFTPIRFQGAMIYRKEGRRDERAPALAP
jgi:chemotaxis protein methyltransferase CheR